MQIDEMNALNVYMRSANPKTPAALKEQLQWKPWFDKLSWFSKTADSNTLKEASRRKQAFIKANMPPPGKVVNAKGKEMAMAAPTRLTVKKGSPKSQNVVDLQNILGLKPADGIFGNNTYNAVIAFQKKNGLKADGIVGPATWEKLLGKQVYVQAAVNQAKQADAVKAAKPPTPVINAPLGTTVLRKGMRGPAVAEWQQKYLGIKADGIFGPETERLTKAWQTKHGLKADGIVGPATRAAAVVAPKVKPAASKPVVQQVIEAPQRVAEAVVEAVANPGKVVEKVKQAPKKASAAVTKAVNAVTPKPIRRWPVWAQVVTTFVAGAVGVGAYNKFTKKP